MSINEMVEMIWPELVKRMKPQYLGAEKVAKKIVAAALRVERERCAQIVEGEGEKWRADGEDAVALSFALCTVTIRRPNLGKRKAKTEAHPEHAPTLGGEG